MICRGTPTSLFTDDDNRSQTNNERTDPMPTDNDEPKFGLHFAPTPWLSRSAEDDREAQLLSVAAAHGLSAADVEVSRKTGVALVDVVEHKKRLARGDFDRVRSRPLSSIILG